MTTAPAPQFALLRPALIMLIAYIVFAASNIFALQQHILLGVIPSMILVAALWFVGPQILQLSKLVEPAKVRTVWRTLALVCSGMLVVGCALMIVLCIFFAFISSDTASLFVVIGLNGLFIFIPMFLGVGAFGLSIAALMISSNQPNMIELQGRTIASKK